MLRMKDRLTKKKSPVQAIAEALKAIRTSDYFSRNQKEIVITIIAEALKEAKPDFSIKKFKEFVRGK